ncbi:hypothetical protein J1614_010596 [Plenodomus biglobosus]|nr:hypothetical protein J1614_010596 [Plenodomus biglobosus]
MSDSRSNCASLRIFPIPFKPSLLSIPPSPFSPRTPLTPNASLRISSSSSFSHTSSFSSNPSRTTTARYMPAPPADPLSWQWTCHQCAHSYPLGVTRRCLDDGHRFCSGTTTVKAWRKPSGTRRVKKHRACASEFDYSGWKAWTRWRRDVREDDPSRRRSHVPQQKPVRRKDCWNNCSYPSECRWGKTYGVHTPTEVVFPSTDLAAITTAYSPLPVQQADLTSTLNQSTKYTLSPTKTPHTNKDTGFWTSLLASAERRKSGTTHTASPLSVVFEEETDIPAPTPRAASLPKDENNDTAMTLPTPSNTIDPQLLAAKPSLTITPMPNMSYMRSSSLPTSQNQLDSRSSPVMLRTLWTRNKKAVSSPLRYRRRTSCSRVKSGRMGGWSVVTEAGQVKRWRGAGDMEVREREEGVLELEEIGVPLVRVGSRDSGCGSCA